MLTDGDFTELDFSALVKKMKVSQAEAIFTRTLFRRTGIFPVVESLETIHKERK